MKLSELTTNDEIVAEMARSDPEFWADWEGTASTRAIALTIVRYRAHHGLAQEDLAQVLGVPLADVDLMELGEAIPPSHVLARFSDLL